MQSSLRNALFLLLVGCNSGGVTIATSTDDAGAAGPDVNPASTSDVGSGVSVNLDASIHSDGGLPICTSDAPENCTPAVCGNGSLEGAEECDDGNTTGGDGCNAECRRESDWVCPTPGQPCISTVVCGDGRISGNEACDDFNTKDGDGCAGDCGAVEPGWGCPAPGMRCQPKCGDGLRIGWEQCDDGNTDSGDGCSQSCTIEAGFACPTPGEPCHETVCGDSVPEGSESCDDGNTIPGDGCSPDCKKEPDCVGTDGCTSPCGDGLKLPEEECDDGNQVSGDGCSTDCKLEPGWDCTQEVEGANSDLVVPILYRDMIPQTAPDTLDPPPNPDFEVSRPSGGGSGRVVPGIVLDTLGADREPQYNPDVDTTLSMTTNADNFNTWYHDSKYSKVVVDTLTLAAQGDGTFIYDHSAKYSGGTWQTPPFFPLDDRGWATLPDGPEIPYLGTCDQDRQKHNFSFTSVVRYWFEYQGGESLSFIGDDDVWVFLNGQLAVDLGGVHVAESGSITLDASTASQFNLTVGKTYEIVVFQAERRQSRSSYKLTLGQFNRTHTLCTPKCGDGIINGTEICDNGPDNSDTAYGGCTATCTRGPYCGDGKVDTAFGEECDDGINVATYGQAGGCAPGCKNAHYCGDGNIDSLYGEQCDNGPDNGKSLCTAACQAIVP